MRLGIDFGTTRTVVASADRGNHPIVDFADGAGDYQAYIPSIVAERDGELRFGLDALAVLDDPSFSILRSFKRLLSTPRVGRTEAVALGKSLLRVEDVVAGFLTHVRRALASHSNLRRKIARDDELLVAIGVPANANAAARFITLEGFRRAGFVVTAIVHEPSAAGFEYTHRYRNTLSSRRDLVVVYDLGGGTFDASVVRMVGRHHDVLATAGVARLGGDDFDSTLAEGALRTVGLGWSDLPKPAADRWLDQCRAAKEALNANSRKISLDLEAVMGREAPKPEITIPVSSFYDACAPLVARSIDAMAPLMDRAEMEASAHAFSEIAGVYVVGGASELPLVGRALRERFGRRVHRSPYPSAAVAIGLSIACDERDDFPLVDRYSRTFGVFREADDGRDVVLDPIFARDVVLPTAGDHVVCTRTYRAKHNVGHYRFFECGTIDDRGKPRGDMALRQDVLFPLDARLLDRPDLSSVPIERRADEGPRIEERYALDRDGMVRVSIRNADAGYERTYRLGE